VSSILTDSTISYAANVGPGYHSRAHRSDHPDAVRRAGMSLLSLHIADDRRAEFETRRHHPVQFDKAMRCWNVTDPAQVLELLRNPDLVCKEIVEPIRAVSRRFGDSFPNTEFLVRHMPLMNEGEPHLTMRRRMAAFLSTRRMPMQEPMRRIVGEQLAPLATAGEHELVASCLLPLVRAFFTEMVQSAETVPFRQLTITRIFDRFLGLSALRQIEVEVAELRAIMARNCSDAVAAGEEDMLIELFTLGRDSLLATISESIAAILAANVGKKLAELDFPDHPHETGVAIAERMAAEPIAVGGVTIPAGDWVRLYLHSLNYSDRADVQKLVFGVGAHTCIGRQLALDLWPMITARLVALPWTIAATDRTYLRNQTFTMPAKISVRFAS
jgi:cytochrome P450